jgi:EAL domain-containing protein (putative c-di-GMP-specific phosphodiesterase class I)
VDLGTEAVVGYEALSRGPADSALESPGALFGAASAAGLSTELDWVCRGSALRAALAADVHQSRAILINVEPASLARPQPGWLSDLIDIACSRLTIVHEITERATANAPANLLAATASMRANGTLLAIDDVGTDPASLALLPFLAPELVKLDIDVTQTSLLSAMARTATAVNALRRAVRGAGRSRGHRSHQASRDRTRLGSRSRTGLAIRPARMSSAEWF